MADWLSSMQQTYEYYIVDPNSWRDVELLATVKSCTVSRDSEVETLGSATIDVIDTMGECYIRVYLITIQNGVTEKHPLGTFLVQTPTSSFNGKVREVSMDAYTPLLELKESPPPLGYSLLKGDNIMSAAYRIARERARAPVVETESSAELSYDFVADPNDTWLSYSSDLIGNAKYKYALDELGRILFAPKQDTASLQPVWEYNDGNSSILYADVSMDHDLYGVPNVVEVIYSQEGETLKSRVVNDDSNSPTSTINRGREIVYRDTNPSVIGEPTQAQIDEYARDLLRALSSIEYTVTYTHGYCGTRLDDCVRLNYERAGLKDIKARIVSQSIKCEPGCPVTEKAVFTTKLWG